MERVSVSDNESSEAVEGCHLTQLAAGEQTSIQFFEFDPESTVPEHSHHHEQTGFIIEGELTFFRGDDETVVGPGESFTIPPEEPHGAENRGDVHVRGLEVFSPPRTEPDWAE